MANVCSFLIKVAKWLPVVFIVTVIVWSYYAYVIQLSLLTVSNIFEKCFYILMYHILLVLFLWSYWQTIFTEIGTVPKQFRLPPAELEQYELAEKDDVRREVMESFTRKRNLPVYNRTMTGEIRYCEKCCHVKPDRCHHCSMCGDCVLKMDHHCPWVNNCVSFSNYKFFMLFLGYGLLYCVFIAATTLQYFIMFWKGSNYQNQLDSSGAGKFHVLFVFFVAIMFAISLMSLFGYHLFLVTKNRSTLESFRGPIFHINNSWIQDKEGFSLGAYNNFLEVFGSDRKKWFLPVFTSRGDGVSFPIRCLQPGVQAPVVPAPVQSYGSTQISQGDGVTYPQRCIEEDADDLLASRQHWLDEEDDLEAGFSNPHMNHYHGNLEEVIVQPNHTNPV